MVTLEFLLPVFRSISVPCSEQRPVVQRSRVFARGGCRSEELRCWWSLWVRLQWITSYKPEFNIASFFRACDARRICRMAQGEQRRNEHSIKYFFLENINALIVHLLPIHPSLGGVLKPAVFWAASPDSSLQWVEHNHLPKLIKKSRFSVCYFDLKHNKK